MATLDPKYLAAICVWESCADFYRDMAYHRGILCNGFVDALAPAQIYSVQYGKGKKGPRSRRPQGRARHRARRTGRR
jgi:predicted acyl esterase